MTTTLSTQPAAPPLTSVDKALADLEAMGIAVKPFDAWKNTVGWAKDDPIYEEAMRLGAEWRAEVNHRSLEEMDRTDGRP